MDDDNDPHAHSFDVSGPLGNRLDGCGGQKIEAYFAVLADDRPGLSGGRENQMVVGHIEQSIQDLRGPDVSCLLPTRGTESALSAVGNHFLPATTATTVVPTA